MNELDYDGIEFIKESVCDGCKGLLHLHETGCYGTCEAFQEALEEMREGESK